VEQQISNTLGLYRSEPALRPPERHLIACDIEGARAVLSLIHGLLPVVSVFFELGREPVAPSSQGLRALRLDEMARHARLYPAEQVIACLKALDEAVQRVSSTPDAMLTALDGEGHCLVADVIARSILDLWQEIVAAHNLTQMEQPLLQAVSDNTSMPVPTPYAISVPAFAVDGKTGNAAA
jgi:hypothetical protein